MELAYAYEVPGGQDFKPTGKVGDRRVYRKQLVYEGDFVKRLKGHPPQPVHVTVADLDHWYETGQLMLSDGVDIPMPLEHTEDPDKNRGLVVGYERGVNEDGKQALYGLHVFDDEKLALSSNVSIYVPPEWEHSQRTYKRPIKHVALTNYSVIPKLGRFEAVALSLADPEPELGPQPRLKEDGMSLSTLAKAMGVEVPDGAKDDDIEKAIGSAFQALKSAKPPEKPKPIAAGFVNLARDNRAAKLEKLVQRGNITPAVRDSLAEQWCSDQALQLSLTADGETTDGFDALVDTLAKNDPVEIGEKTGPQGVVALSAAELSDDEKNPLLRDAKRRVNLGG